ncbi:MAG: hypothetical protein L0387_36250 [Acidobacteria bacterium]|nr:hypothetical protein [Acidobacteriota bacterium]MCI0719219.1 hypothetical protein [Acidobacteriota bacterium]
MKRYAYFCVSSDADPDFNPPYSVVPSQQHESIWRGIFEGIPILRRRLKETDFVLKHGPLPISWLLRADRQIHQLYGDASFCFKQFDDLWKSEQGQGSEIGWHPHLHRWNRLAGHWAEYLDQDDDLEILAECLHSLRQCTTINVVRTGWGYHSNALMELFDKEGLLVDASAIPGSVQSGSWHHDWRGAPRTPYSPSKLDYRYPAESLADALNILVMPTLVRTLPPGLQGLRYGLRKLRAISSSCADLTDWESSRYQGVRITSACPPFSEAFQQTLAASSQNGSAFLNVYFHPDELSSPRALNHFLRNLENTSRLAERMGWTLLPTTLGVAASVVRSEVSVPGKLESDQSRVAIPAFPAVIPND